MKTSYERDRKRDKKRNKRKYGMRIDGGGYHHIINRKRKERSKGGK